MNFDWLRILALLCLSCLSGSCCHFGGPRPIELDTDIGVKLEGGATVFYSSESEKLAALPLGIFFGITDTEDEELSYLYFVLDIEKGSPAAAVDVQLDDVLVAIEGVVVTNVFSLGEAYQLLREEVQSDNSVDMTFLRGGEYVEVDIAPRPVGALQDIRMSRKGHGLGTAPVKGAHESR